MDLVIVVVFCNCAIAILILAITMWIVGFRKQVTALRTCFDRWDRDCNLLLIDAPQSLADRQAQVYHLRQIYQQQSISIDRLRSLGLFWGIARYLLFKRRRG